MYLAINLIAHVIDVQPHVPVVIRHVSGSVEVWLVIYNHESLYLHTPPKNNRKQFSC